MCKQFLSKSVLNENIFYSYLDNGDVFIYMCLYMAYSMVLINLLQYVTDNDNDFTDVYYCNCK